MQFFFRFCRKWKGREGKVQKKKKTVKYFCLHAPNKIGGRVGMRMNNVVCLGHFDVATFGKGDAKW